MFAERFLPRHFEKAPDDPTFAKEPLPAAPESGVEKAHERAAEIAGEGNYAAILQTLRTEGLFQDEKMRVEEEYALDDISFLTEGDREMFTVLDLYDPGTARHCLETYQIAKEKMEKEMLPGVSFARILAEQEGVTLEQFYRACLFHDIGKVEVPRSVILDHTDEGHMLEHLHHVYHMLYHDGKIPEWLHLGEDATEQEIDQAFRRQHVLRCIQLVPAQEVLPPEGLAEVQRFGYTGEETLADIISTHETRSGEILSAAGYAIESNLAALHHNYDKKVPEHPISVSVLQIDINLADMLHIADVSQALRSSERTYKGAFTEPKVMRIIAEQAQERNDPSFTLAAYLWLTDDMRKYRASPREGAQNSAQYALDERHSAAVKAFLEQAERDVGPKLREAA
jgi:hypothetical protein